MIKSKRLLRFYFNVDGLNKAIDNLIITYACRSSDCTKSGSFWVERIVSLMEAKNALGSLWCYLDGVVSPFKADEIETLKSYAFLRCGIRRLDEARRREIKRVLIKFARHARALDRFAEGVRLVGEYYCLI